MSKAQVRLVFLRVNQTLSPATTRRLGKDEKLALTLASAILIYFAIRIIASL